MTKEKWIEQNKWKMFKEGMEEALCLLQYGKTKSQKTMEDMLKSYGAGENPFEAIFNKK